MSALQPSTGIHPLVAATTAKDTQLQQTARVAPTPDSVITTNFGVKVDDTTNSLRAGARGPLLMEDFHFREKINHFDHERIPERVVHARGTAAHGYFQPYKSMASVTKAKFLSDPNVKTPVFVRFSTVLGSRGSADTVRDVRGFATKFYTEEGIWDLVGNNIPVFFIQDAIKFPDIIHAGKPEPHTEIPQAQSAHDNFWDFISLTPESAHMVMWAMSDRAIPRSYRMMEGFGVHTFALINAQGERRFVKFHWKPLLGVHGLVWDEAQKLGGQDPDFHRRDLFEAIEAGAYPEYELGFQIVEEKDEHKFDFDLLDPTKIIPEEMVPVQKVGKMVLNKNVEDFFAETEQVAFCTQHVVPGIDFTDDPLLQGRNFSYLDTQITRLGGPNFMEIPINRPTCPVMNNQRDGFMRQRISQGRVNYFPNRLGCPALAPQLSQVNARKRKQDEAENSFVTYAEKIAGIKERLRAPKFHEHFNQATLFYNSLTKPEKEHLLYALQFELSRVDDRAIHERMLQVLVQIEPEIASHVAVALGLPAPAPKEGWKNHGQKSAALSMELAYPKDSIRTRKVAVLVADGFDAPTVTDVRSALAAQGALPILVGVRKGVIKGAGGEEMTAAFTVWNSKSTLFDAVYVPGGAASIHKLLPLGDAQAFIAEAFKHCKAIAATGEGVNLLHKAIPPQAAVKISAAADAAVLSDQGVVTSGKGAVAAEFIKAIAQHRFWARKAEVIPA